MPLWVHYDNVWPMSYFSMVFFSCPIWKLYYRKGRDFFSTIVYQLRSDASMSALWHCMRHPGLQHAWHGPLLSSQSIPYTAPAEQSEGGPDCRGTCRVAGWQLSLSLHNNTTNNTEAVLFQYWACIMQSNSSTVLGNYSNYPWSWSTVSILMTIELLHG